MRLFLAIPVPEALERSLISAQSALESGNWSLKLTQAQDFHVTLHFLGETPDNLLDDLHHDLSACAHRHRPFDLKVGGLSAFPSFENPRVLWTGIEDGKAKLKELFEDTRRVLNRYRLFKLNDQLEQPHLTLARVEKLGAAWDSKLPESILATWNSLGNLPVEEFRLLRSHLNQPGARYEMIETFKLGGN